MVNLHKKHLIGGMEEKIVTAQLQIEFGMNKYILDTENQNFDIPAPVILSVKFDHSFSSS